MKPYIKILIKQNLAYFIILLAMIVGSLISIGYLTNAYASTATQITQTQSEVLSLSQRRTVLQSLANNKSEDLSQNLEIMNSLIPNSEDYFSIIYALDQLSQKTGFIINSYTVDLTASKTDRLAISVSGVGDSQAFLEFLKDYNTGGGRLITAETIQLDSANNGNIRLQLYFYNKAASGDNLDATQNYEQALKNFDKIKSKVSVAVIGEPQNESNINTQYTPKSNPF